MEAELETPPAHAFRIAVTMNTIYSYVSYLYLLIHVLCGFILYHACNHINGCEWECILLIVLAAIITH